MKFERVLLAVALMAGASGALAEHPAPELPALSFQQIKADLAAQASIVGEPASAPGMSKPATAVSKADDAVAVQPSVIDAAASTDLSGKALIQVADQCVDTRKTCGLGLRFCEPLPPCMMESYRRYMREQKEHAWTYR